MDYVAQSATLTIAASATSAVIKIPIIAATVAEPNEDFHVNLTGATSAALGQTQGTGLITNNLPWFVNSTGDLAVRDPSASPWTGHDNVNGDPECTLYSDIQYLDATGGGSVNFDIPNVPEYCTNGVYTINTGDLPALTQPITVDGSSQTADGTSQTSYPGTPVIDVNGGGFTVSDGAAGSEIDSLAITRASGSGVVLDDTTGGDTVQDCYIGVAPDVAPNGPTAAGNAAYGILIDGSPWNTIQNNVISANASGGIHITGGDATSNFVTQNMIGTNSSGTKALGTQGVGVLIDGGAQGNQIGASGSGNVISGNQGNGVTIDGGTEDANTVQDNVVEGNYIGTNATNSLNVGNTGDGVAIIGWCMTTISAAAMRGPTT